MGHHSPELQLWLKYGRFLLTGNLFYTYGQRHETAGH
jgi:hypothetical protein